MRSLILLLCLVLLTFPGTARDVSVQPEDAYLIPQRVFVGDSGRLALPLSTALPGVRGAVLDDPGALPRAPGLIITRVELENRGETCHLIVDFRAYTPGVIALPPIEIASLTFRGLNVHIASILEAEGNALVLSGPAPPLAVPGTMGMIYGTALGIVAFIAGFALLVLRGGPAFRRWRDLFRRRHLLWSMGKVLRNLRLTLDSCGQGQAAEALDNLSREFRTFLGLFTGMNCRAMTGEEFLLLPPLTPDPAGPFLTDFFRRCDALRFSGGEIEGGCVTELLGQVRDFIGKMEKNKEGGRWETGALPRTPLGGLGPPRPSEGKSEAV
ncbi:MAG: hypothetical protein LBF74_07490 [Treponema sp.]|jgi:hypothetical protein|nr:hypothetical protein [Treponema sp.]